MNTIGLNSYIILGVNEDSSIQNINKIYNDCCILAARYGIKCETDEDTVVLDVNGDEDVIIINSSEIFIKNHDVNKSINENLIFINEALNIVKNHNSELRMKVEIDFRESVNVPGENLLELFKNKKLFSSSEDPLEIVYTGQTLYSTIEEKPCVIEISPYFNNVDSFQVKMQTGIILESNESSIENYLRFWVGHFSSFGSKLYDYLRG